MRISKVIILGHLEIFIGRRPHWVPEWNASRIALGYGLWLGHWTFMVCRRRKSTLRRAPAEPLGLTVSELKALERADAEAAAKSP